MIQFSANKLLLTSEGKQMLSVSFTVEKGKILALYGESGVGKTTILRILAGLTDCDKAFIEVDGEVWYDTAKKIYKPPQQRSIGFVFQDLALFPNMDIRQNISFALPKNANANEVDNIIEIMELKGVEKSKPDMLSGGQKQRVAIARAILRKPKILLLDEPLSSLDNRMRTNLENYIKRIHAEYNLTTILVTHHLPEVLRMADEVIVIERGKISKNGTPYEVFASQNNGAFELTGEVIDIKANNHGFTVIVLFNNTIIPIETSSEEANNLSISQQVIIIMEGPKPILKKE